MTWIAYVLVGLMASVVCLSLFAVICLASLSPDEDAALSSELRHRNDDA